MANLGFIGRRREIGGLRRLRKKRTSSLVVIRGRRRIGKSRLAEEFAKENGAAYRFSGLPPHHQLDARAQRAEFANQMRQQEIPRLGGEDWSDLFLDLARHTAEREVVILFDEISWMGSKDKTFLGKLKTAWDLHFKSNSKLILILSGSNSLWIEQNILSSTGFFGRISLRLYLQELPVGEAANFWGSHAPLVSAYEKFKLLAVTGGVPRYLEELDPTVSAEENLSRMCFDESGLLFSEFDELFSDLFSRKKGKYRDICEALARRPLTLSELATELNRERGGDLSESLEELEKSGLIASDPLWVLKTGARAKGTRFRLRDNYLRFYLKYIEPAKDRILREGSAALPAGWQGIMGLQFENLVLASRQQLYEVLGIRAADVIQAGPYRQKQTSSCQGCQIDLLIQDRFRTLYLCEIKFSQAPIEASVVREVQEKVKRLSCPRNCSIRPVLIHVNGVNDSVLAEDYFAQVVDFSQFLEGGSV